MDHTTKGIEEDSVADSIGSIDNAPTLELHHDGLTIDGYSRAAVQTYWRIAELKIGFDLGAQPWDFMSLPRTFISHSHLDHVLGVPLLADSVIRRRAGRPPIQVHGLSATLAALRDHVLNGVIWPDFTRLPSADRPVLALQAFDIGQVLLFGQRRIEVLPARHTVPAVGFALLGSDGGGAWVFTGDTGPNPALWQRLRSMRVRHLVIETTFRDADHPVASASRHLHPAALGLELAQLAEGTEVHITHVKPGEMPTVMAEIGALDPRHRIRALAAGQVMVLA